ncbi:MAG: hypothetical protein SCALA702_26200 [Melioribacteraceae bacterium]|nr:MAG: hypothetical protein SCALA702_26200 [Melioribacteraceae bacterium]
MSNILNIDARKLLITAITGLTNEAFSLPKLEYGSSMSIRKLLPDKNNTTVSTNTE